MDVSNFEGFKTWLTSLGEKGKKDLMNRLTEIQKLREELRATHYIEIHANTGIYEVLKDSPKVKKLQKLLEEGKIKIVWQEKK
jgi:hypothetical protein